MTEATTDEFNEPQEQDLSPEAKATEGNDPVGGVDTDAPPTEPEQALPADAPPTEPEQALPSRVADKQAKKRHLALKTLLVVALCLIALLGAGAGYLYYHDQQMTDVVPQGVTFQQESFGGLRNNEVRPKVEAILADLGSQQINLQVADTKQSTPIMGFVSFDTTPAVDAITSIRASIPLLQRIRYEWSFKLRSYNIPFLNTLLSRTIPLSYSLREQAVASYVAGLAQKSATAAVNAQLTLPEGSRAPVITPEINGMTVETTATIEQLSQAVRAAIRENQAQSITVATRMGAPEVTAASLKNAAVIVVHLSAKQMELYRGTTLVRSMVTATGKPGYETRPGDYFIGAMRRNPTWINPHEDWSMNMPETMSGPNGPLGARAMNVVKRNEAGQIVDYGYRIHGGTVGAGASSHGCLHLSNSDVIWLFDQVELGTPVFIRP